MKPLIGVVSWALLTAAAAAQAPQGGPKPSPELKRQSYYLGTWKCEGTTQASASGPGSTSTSTSHTAWGLGGFFLVERGEFSDGGMNGKDVSYIGYDPQKKVYTFDSFNSMGESVHATGTVSGKTWTWKSPSNTGDKPGRVIITEDSPTSYSFKFESSADDGKTWTRKFEDRCTKQSSVAAAAKKRAK